METISPSSSFSIPRETSTYDELSMQQSLLFTNTLKDLKNLRLQLYSAAEYFELSYTHDDQKQMVVNTLKDYAVKALVNTVDHLGSVTYKVNGLLDEQVDEVSGTEFRVACIEQRLRMCQEYTDREGLLQQTISMTTPKYHKRYILPGKVLYGSGDAAAKYQDNLDNENHNGLRVIKSSNENGNGSQVFKSSNENDIGSRVIKASNENENGSREIKPSSENENGLRLIKTAPKTRDTSSSSFRKSNSRSLSPRYGKFCFTETGPVSPRTTSYSLVRSGSLSSRPTAPNSSNTGRQVTSKSASMRLRTDTDGQEEKQQPTKSKRLLKALLSRRKSKKDPMLYTYLDEY